MIVVLIVYPAPDTRAVSLTHDIDNDHYGSLRTICQAHFTYDLIWFFQSLLWSHYRKKTNNSEPHSWQGEESRPDSRLEPKPKVSFPFSFFASLCLSFDMFIVQLKHTQDGQTVRWTGFFQFKNAHLEASSSIFISRSPPLGYFRKNPVCHSSNMLQLTEESRSLSL